MSANVGRAHRSLAQSVLELYPDEAARLFDDAPPAEVAALLDDQPAARSVQVLERLSPDQGALVLAAVSPATAKKLLRTFSPHRAAALLARLDREQREARLAQLDPALAHELRSLTEYPADTAGGLMEPRVVAFRPSSTVREVIRRLRSLRRTGVQDVFLVDERGRLLGSVSLQDIVLAALDERLDELVKSRPVFVTATASRDEVVSELETHRVGSLPVVDFDGRLIGVLRQQELINAARQDATADLLTMVGVSADERALSTPMFAVKKRLPWLQINLLTAFLAAAVVGIFEGTIAKFTALAVLLPVVAGQSGNTGAQALAVTMRGLALREIRTSHWVRVVMKELAVGAANGVAVALTTSVAVYIWSQSLGLALVIAISMVISMTAAGFAGAAIPVILAKLNQDPANSGSIILTTVTDVVGFLSFLGIATLFASMLPG